MASSEEQQPMSAARLAEIRDVVDWNLRADNGVYASHLASMASDLLAENERLRTALAAQEARAAALVAVVRAVAESDGHMARLWDGSPVGYMLLPKHEGIIEQARALLASAADEAK